jgi:CHASE2 domain-containing sensor protein
MNDTVDTRRSGGDAGSGTGTADRGKSLLTPDRLARYRERLVDVAVLGLPIALVNWVLKLVSDRVISQPWYILWFVVPLAFATWVVWLHVMRRGDFRIRRSMLVFLICYLLVFSLAAGSNLLVWKRSTVMVNEAVAPRNWLAPAWWGDWRYRFANRPPSDLPLVIVVVEEPTNTATLRSLRLQLAQLVAVAMSDSALGIAFDFYFGQESSPLDSLLCSVVQRADGMHIPVIAGQRVVSTQSGLDAEDYVGSIEPCFPAENRGYLLGYRDADGVVRNVVLHTRLITRESAPLSLRVAGHLGQNRTLSSHALMQFVEPRDSFPLLEYEQLGKLPPSELRHWINHRWVLVGERSPSETFHTPFGDRLGVQVHAAAIASLVAGTGVERSPWWSGMLLVLVAGYLIAVLAGGGWPPQKLMAVALGISAFVVVAAVLAIRLWQVWLDVVYPLVALWALFGLLLLLRTKLGSVPTRGDGPHARRP